MDPNFPHSTDTLSVGTPTPEPPLEPPPRRSLAVPAVVAVNVAVFVLWLLARDSKGLERFLELNFLLSLGHVLSLRPWVLLTAAFSHYELWHLLFNMMAFASFGRLFEQVWGPARFLRFYLAAAVVSSVTHCLLSLLGWPDVPALGASGAISAVVIVFTLVFPKEKILLFGIVPLPAWFATGGFVLWDLWGLVAQRGGGGMPIGHGAHLGGAAFGLAYWLAVVRPEIRRARREALRRLGLPEEWA